MGLVIRLDKFRPGLHKMKSALLGREHSLIHRVIENGKHPDQLNCQPRVND